MKRRTFLKGAIATLSASGLPVHARLTDSDRHGSVEPARDSEKGGHEPFSQQPFVCKVVSIGGAGNRIVTSQMGRLLDARRVIAIDTNVHALNAAMANEKILLSKDADTTFTQGNPKIAEELAWKVRQRIENSLADAHMVFVVAGMGGGTGSGVASVVVKIAKQVLSKGSKVIAVVTTPFSDEREQRKTVAGSGLIALHRWADSVIKIPNGRLFDWAWQMNPPMQIPEFHRYASRAFGEAYAALAGSILRPGMAAVDFEDLRTVLACGPIASVGWGDAESWIGNAAVIAAQGACNHPLLGEDRIAQASGLLVSIAAESAGCGDVRDVLREIRRRTRDSARVVVSVDAFDVRMEGIDVRIIAVA